MEFQKSVILCKKKKKKKKKNQKFNLCRKCSLSIKKHNNENHISFWPAV